MNAWARLSLPPGKHALHRTTAVKIVPPSFLFKHKKNLFFFVLIANAIRFTWSQTVKVKLALYFGNHSTVEPR